MNNALIGFSGFVGTTLQKQFTFQNFYNSKNIQEIVGQEFDLTICAAAPAQKWIANKNPQADLQNIENLTKNLRQMRSKTFVLISTVDVFKNPKQVNEETIIDVEDLHPYGAHRFMLEKFVEKNFPNHLIVRLSGLVGQGLRKNIIFDFAHNNNLEAIDSRAIFQFYPMSNLMRDIQVALAAKLRLVHLTSEPISVEEVAAQAFDKNFVQVTSNNPAIYDMQTIHAKLFGGVGAYQYSKQETIQAIRSYAENEIVKS